MASDILIYGADIVPVGADQKQHVEYARDIAGYYNRAYNVEEFKLPKDLIVESVASLPGIDGQKMSKSYNNHIELFCSDEDLKKRVMSIVTDSASPEEKKNPDENNIYKIHRLFLNDEENRDLRAKFENGGYGYKQAKEELLTTLMKWREGKKEKYDELVSNPSFIFSLLKEGGEQARKKAEEKMEIVRKQVGLSYCI
jgi:tryptophanyl-tRNA synthetase